MPWTCDRSLILVGGKGGVGKTTVACAVALEAAVAGHRVRLLSTDPAHSVWDALGAHGGGVAPLPAGLQVEEVDADALVEQFRDRYRHLISEIALRGTVLDPKQVEALLELGLPGQDELMALLRLAECLDDPAIDTVVVDTAPTGHTLRLLDQPDLLNAWITALDALVEKHRFMRARFAHDDGPDHLDRFLEHHRALAERLHARFRDPDRTAFIVVELPEAVVHAETVELLDALDARGVPVPAVVVNRWEGEVLPDDGRERVVLPVCAVEPVGPEALLAAWATRLRPTATSACGPRVVRDPPRADAPLPADVGARSWLWLAGKGGVGKTTIACALASALSAADPDRRVLLVSTDPAHSLAAVLEHDVQDCIRPIHDGLHAVHLDAAAAFEELRDAHATDVEALFGATVRGFDPVYDRAALEHLLDLAPPGIDEVMALARAARVAARGDWDQVVVDTAPTGHFLRLMGMPDVLEAWLRWAFDVLLEQRDILRLPRLSAELVQRNREIRAFHRLLQDPARSGVVVVARPTAVTWAETRDLLADVAGVGVNPLALVWNQTEGSLPEGAADVGLPTVEVPRGRAPVGLSDLCDLGRSLLGDAAHSVLREAG